MCQYVKKINDFYRGLIEYRKNGYIARDATWDCLKLLLSADPVESKGWWLINNVILITFCGIVL